MPCYHLLNFLNQSLFIKHLSSLPLVSPWNEENYDPCEARTGSELRSRYRTPTSGRDIHWGIVGVGKLVYQNDHNFIQRDTSMIFFNYTDILFKNIKKHCIIW